MIERDAAGVEVFRMDDGTLVPAIKPAIEAHIHSNVDLKTSLVRGDGTAIILATDEALAYLATSNRYWRSKAQALETQVADLRQQLQLRT